MLQLSSGSFLAYDAICPHAGCTVGTRARPAHRLAVPRSEFTVNGDVIQGCPPRPHVATRGRSPDGELYVKQTDRRALAMTCR